MMADSSVTAHEDGAQPGPATPTAELDRRYELLVVVGILAALLMGALDNFVVLTALKKILTEFGQPTTSGTFVVSAYVIASTISIGIFSKLSDIWSRRNVFLGGLAIFIVGSMLSGISQNLSELILFRAVQGFGSGGFFPVGIAIVAVTFSPETRARVIGALSGVFGIAVVAGPLLGAFIVQFGWRWVFYVNLPIGILGFALIAAVLGPLRPLTIRRFDLGGAALLSGWVAALMFPLYQIADSGWGWTDPRVVGLLLLAAILAIVFVVWEYRSHNPLVPLRLFARRVMSAGGGATFFIGMVFFPVATFLSLVVGAVLAPPGSNAADIVRDMLYALVIPLVIGAALGGQLLTRLSYRSVAALGVVVGTVGMFGLTRMTTTTALWTFYAGFFPVGGLIVWLIPMGFGLGLTFPVFLLAAQNQVGTADVGEAGGLMQFLQSLGGAVGLAVLASYQQTRFAALGSFAAFPGSLVQSYDQTFSVMLLLLVVALAFVLFLRGRLPAKALPAKGSPVPVPPIPGEGTGGPVPGSSQH